MQSAAPELGRDFRFLLMTLVLAPLLEEGIFRWGIFARLRSRISCWPAAVSYTHRDVYKRQDLQRIKAAADKDKEIAYQIKATKAKLEAMGIVTEDLDI